LNEQTKEAITGTHVDKDRLALNRIYEMKIIKDGKQIGSEKFTLGKDNLSDKINSNLAQLLRGYIDSANLE
jgi:hypothetical protein